MQAYEEDVAPARIGADVVDTQQATGEKTAESSGEGSTDDVAREAEAELVLAVEAGELR